MEDQTGDNWAASTSEWDIVITTAYFVCEGTRKRRETVFLNGNGHLARKAGCVISEVKRVGGVHCAAADKFNTG